MSSSSDARSGWISLAGAAPILALLIWWVTAAGGYAPTVWMPGAVVLAALLALLIAGRPVTIPSRAAAGALAALAAYTVWSFASVAWADAPGPALEGSQRTLLYAVAFAVCVVLPWTPGAARTAVAAFIMVATVAATVTLLRATTADGAADLFFTARLSAPLGYFNATAALVTMAALPALVLAGRREVAPWLRPLLLAAAVLLLGVAILTQSRGWLFTLPLLLLAAILMAPDRGCALCFAAPCAVGVGVTAGPLLEPFRRAGALPGDAAAQVLASSVGDALPAVAAGAAVAAAGGLVALAAERRWRRPPRERRRSRVTVGALLAAVLVIGGAGVAVSHPAQRVQRAWDDFRNPVHTVAAGTTRFGSASTTRYDFWRVSLDLWRSAPIVGLGQDNFAQPYLRERANDFEEPRWTHSLVLRLLVHTGLIGAALFAAFLAAVVAAARGADASTRAVVLLPGIVWLAHGAVEWLWEYPMLSVAAFAGAGMAVAIGGDARPVRLPPPVTAGGCAIVLLATVTILPVYVAGRDVRRASAQWPGDPATAFRRLDRARALNPLDARPSVVEGIVAAELGRLPRARTAFTRAARREPEDWLAPYQLGLLAARSGDRAEAGRQLLLARARNPRDALVADALQRLRHHRHLPTPRASLGLLRLRVRKRFDG